MGKLVSAAVAVSLILVASAAWACGGPPPPPTPGRPGTTVAEGQGSISVFSGNPSGYSWDRIQLPSATRTHVGEISGEISGSIETDPRVNTAIAGQLGQVVRIGANGANEISPEPEAQTTTFGAVLSAELKWQVLTYVPSSGTVALFSESGDGTFSKVATLSADCGSATMLDLVVEPDGSRVGLCGGAALELRDGALTRVELPVPAMSLSHGSDGHAVAYGLAANGTDLSVMTHGPTGWSVGSTIATSAAPQLVFPIDETSVLVKHPAGFTAYTLSNGTWQASAPLDASTLVSSATGSPAQVLSGDYELTLHATDGTANGAWTATDLGALGIAPVQPSGPQEGAGFGCSIVGTGVPLALLAALSLARLKRRRAQA